MPRKPKDQKDLRYKSVIAKVTDEEKNQFTEATKDNGGESNVARKLIQDYLKKNSK